MTTSSIDDRLARLQRRHRLVREQGGGLTPQERAEFAARQERRARAEERAAAARARAERRAAKEAQRQELWHKRYFKLNCVWALGAEQYVDITTKLETRLRWEGQWLRRRADASHVTGAGNE